jgi:hypothetical protein
VGPNISEIGAGGDQPRISHRQLVLILVAVVDGVTISCLHVIGEESGRHPKLPTHIRIHRSFVSFRFFLPLFQFSLWLFSLVVSFEKEELRSELEGEGKAAVEIFIS